MCCPLPPFCPGAGTSSSRATPSVTLRDPPTYAPPPRLEPRPPSTRASAFVTHADRSVHSQQPRRRSVHS
eukprot:1472193-Prymnesium_polylepis.1